MDLDNICIVKVKDVFACSSPKSKSYFSCDLSAKVKCTKKKLFLVCHCLEKSSSSGFLVLKDIYK